MSKTKENPKSETKNNAKNIVATIILIIVSVTFGYFLGSLFGIDFGTSEDNSKWAGTYTTDKWYGHGAGTLVLNKDGTCKLPTAEGEHCTYKVKDGYVYFNGIGSSSTAIGENGIVYNGFRFEKLK